MAIAEELLTELENSIRDLLDNYQVHDGQCTNHYQKNEVKKIPTCTKCSSAVETRRHRVEFAIEQIQLLRDVFSGIKQ